MSSPNVMTESDWERKVADLERQLAEAQQAREAANQRWIAAADHAKEIAAERDTLRGSAA